MASPPLVFRLLEIIPTCLYPDHIGGLEKPRLPRHPHLLWLLSPGDSHWRLCTFAILYLSTPHPQLLEAFHWVFCNTQNSTRKRKSPVSSGFFWTFPLIPVLTEIRISFEYTAASRVLFHSTEPESEASVLIDINCFFLDHSPFLFPKTH